jgi:hypothetical protein
MNESHVFFLLRVRPAEGLLLAGRAGEKPAAAGRFPGREMRQGSRPLERARKKKNLLHQGLQWAFAGGGSSRRASRCVARGAAPVSLSNWSRYRIRLQIREFVLIFPFAMGSCCVNLSSQVCYCNSIVYTFSFILSSGVSWLLKPWIVSPRVEYLNKYHQKKKMWIRFRCYEIYQNVGRSLTCW